MATPNEFIVKGETGKKLDERLTPLVQDVMRSRQLPGMAIGVVADNEMVYARGFGVKRTGTREPISMTTVFHMASVSKPFVATAIMQLVEQGQVQLDAPVMTYLPYFELADDRYREINIQQMLSHVSGMPDVEGYDWDKPEYDEGALERYVRSVSGRKLLSEPGTQFAYSNLAFECLGDVIAKVSGMPFDDYVKVHILNPAGMAESSFLMPAHLPENWAAPHVRVVTDIAWKGYPYNRSHGPSSTLHSNAVEMCNWAIANLRRGTIGSKRILSALAYDLLWKPWFDIGEGRQAGLSWFLAEYHGEKTVEHGGGDVGFTSQLILLPDKRSAAVVLCNLIPAPLGTIARSALDLLLGQQPAPILPSASQPVYQTLSAEGVDAAAAQWSRLRSDHPDEYDWTSPVPNLYNAAMMHRAKDAGRIAGLCARILPEPEVKAIEEILSAHPSRAATAALRAIRAHRQGA